MIYQVIKVKKPPVFVATKEQALDMFHNRVKFNEVTGSVWGKNDTYLGTITEIEVQDPRTDRQKVRDFLKDFRIKHGEVGDVIHIPYHFFYFEDDKLV